MHSRSNAKKLAASAAVLAAVGAFVSFGAFSAFTSSAENQSNLGTAKIELTGVPSTGTLLVNLSNLIPGDLIERCVAVTNGSDVDTSIALTKVTGGNSALLDGLVASVEEGTLAAGQTASATCTGFSNPGTFIMGTSAIDTSDLALYTGGRSLTSGSFVTKTYTDWPTTGSTATKYFRFRVALPPTVDNTLQNKDSTLQFVFTATPSRAPTGV